MSDLPSTRGHHLLFLAPGAGLVVTLIAWARRTDPDGRADLAAAARWQALGAFIVGMHAVLQLGIAFVSMSWRAGPGVGATLDAVFPVVLRGLTLLNVGSGVAEWGLMAAWAIAASRGRPYPDALLRGLRSRPPGGPPSG